MPSDRFGRRKVHADNTYDFDRCRRYLRNRSIIPRVAKRGIESSSHLGKLRWVVELTIADAIIAFRARKRFCRAL